MSAAKERLTVTVDPALLAAGRAAVEQGRAESLSAWVNAAIAERVARERKLRALAEAIELYEEEHGVISDAELAAQERADRRSAVVVRGGRRTPRKTRRGGR